jgi:hypothetical protein
MSYDVTIDLANTFHKRGEFIGKGKISSVYPEPSKKIFLGILLFDLAFVSHEYILFYFPAFLRMLSS